MDDRTSASGLVVVLGGGVAGLAAAGKLRRAGWRVRIIERAGRLGGTHRSRQIGPYTFDVGSIFYESDAKLFDLAPGVRNLCPQVMRVQRRVAPDGTIRHYPLEPREFLHQRPLCLARAIIDLGWSRLTLRRDGTLDAIACRRLGRSFFESSGLASYIARFHQAPASQIDESFFLRRMAFVERATRLGALARLALHGMVTDRPLNAKSRKPLHVRPRDGVDPIFDRIGRNLIAAGVQLTLGEELQSLRREGALFHVQTTSGAFRAQAVVSTIPLDTLHRAIFGAASGLTSLDMMTLFVSAAWLDARLGNVLFNFHPLGRWKRATIYSRIYPTPCTGREFLAVETTVAASGQYDPQAIFEDFRQHVEQLGLAAGLILEGYEHVENCYPLYHTGSQSILAQILHRIARTGVVLAGRQGRFEYLPTSSGVIRRVIEELDVAGPVLPTSEMAA
ncbi:FAD-dependent oxidoreductase [Novosphingobium sp.]|uniref:FAD-dependent oxidoreductase n=1 Tax=Novosphingobium sp. TaxID=1874826 RepID=UPI002FD99E62